MSSSLFSGTKLFTMGKFACLCILLIIVIIAFCDCNVHTRDRKEKKGRSHKVKMMKLTNAMEKFPSHIDSDRKHKSQGVSREKSIQDVQMYDVARFSKHGKHGKSYKKKGKKHSRNGVSWIKFRPSSDCILKCQKGEMCIVGPLDAKPFCVGKRNIKKSIKLFHRHQKKEMAEWRKFSKEHYHKYSEKKSNRKNDNKKSHMGKLKKHSNRKGARFNKGYKQNSKPYFPPTKDGECTTADFAQMRIRMMGWFHLLHGQDHLMKKQEKVSLKHFHKHISVKKELREHEGNTCQCFKSAIWQFSQMDADQDDHLTEKEMGMIENKLEPCVKPYLTSCDRNSDGVLSSAEWCCCFSNVVPPCFRKLDELRRSGDKITYVPRCDKEGYYMREQCQGDSTEGQNYGCWCVDYNGNEYKGSHTTGRAHCSKLALNNIENVRMT